MSRDYNELASQVLINAYNSKSTIEAIAESLSQFEDNIKREVAQQLLDDFKELDAECRKCDDADETMYSWCDFNCILQNGVLSVMRNLGYTVNSLDELTEI